MPLIESIAPYFAGAILFAAGGLFGVARVGLRRWLLGEEREVGT